MSRKSTTFTVDVDGVATTFKVYEPTLADQKEANKVRNEAFHDAVTSKAPLRNQLSLMIQNNNSGLTQDQDDQYEEFTKQILNGEKRLAEGGFDLEDAKLLALKMSSLRNSRRKLLADLGQMDNNTAEGQADNMQFNYLVSACLMYNKDKKEQKYFTGLEDYLNNSSTETAITAANKLSGLIYGIGEDADKKLPENMFLKEFGFIDDNLRLINEAGKFVNTSGDLVNEEGFLIDADGNLIDVDGNFLTEDGDYKVEFKGFTKDDGTVVMGGKDPVETKTAVEKSVDDKVTGVPEKKTRKKKKSSTKD